MTMPNSQGDAHRGNSSFPTQPETNDFYNTNPDMYHGIGATGTSPVAKSERPSAQINGGPRPAPATPRGGLVATNLHNITQAGPSTDINQSSSQHDDDYNPQLEEETDSDEDEEVQGSEGKPSRSNSASKHPLRKLKHVLETKRDGTVVCAATAFIVAKGYVRLGKNPDILMRHLFKGDVTGQDVVIKCLPANELIAAKVSSQQILQMREVRDHFNFREGDKFEMKYNGTAVISTDTGSITAPVATLKMVEAPVSAGTAAPPSSSHPSRQGDATMQHQPPMRPENPIAAAGNGQAENVAAAPGDGNGASRPSHGAQFPIEQRSNKRSSPEVPEDQAAENKRHAPGRTPSPTSDAAPGPSNGHAAPAAAPARAAQSATAAEFRTVSEQVIRVDAVLGRNNVSGLVQSAINRLFWELRGSSEATAIEAQIMRADATGKASAVQHLVEMITAVYESTEV